MSSPADRPKAAHTHNRWYPTPGDLLDFLRMIVMLLIHRPRPRTDRYSLARRVEENAAQFPERLMCLFEGRQLTWGAFNERANRFAHLFADQGIGKGDRVALLMENRPDFLQVVTGLNKRGAIAGLINTNLHGPALIHSLKTTSTNCLVFGEELLPTVRGDLEDIRAAGITSLLMVKDHGTENCPPWAEDVSRRLLSCSPENPASTGTVSLKDPCFYIFTSGTTGLPKAAVVSHHRWLTMSQVFCLTALRLKPKDRTYLCLPLYHSSAMFAGFGATIAGGSAIFLRRKFSARNFWQEVHDHKTTCFIYIGELCRYLLNQDPSPMEQRNPLQRCTGNGLRPDIWMEFKQRFGLRRISEFYGASEGNSGFLNVLNRNCTVGVSVSPFALVQYAVSSGAAERDGAGFCRQVPDFSPGLLLTEITDKTVFDGYTSATATDKKILRDVFHKGDAWLNTGDLVRRVNAGPAFGLKHYQFVDRLGDTFRWRGENVSTNEVSEVINRFDDVEYSNVYGVHLPGTDGRAGMVALKPRSGKIDMDRFSGFVNQNLPRYSRPVFVRLIEEMETTSTFKQKKSNLVEDAYHPDRCQEKVWVRKPDGESYERLDPEYYRHVIEGSSGY